MTRIVVRLMQAAMFFVAATNAVAQTAPATTAASQADKPAPGAESQQARQLKVSGKVWTGDFDKMLERRIIRVAMRRTAAPSTSSTRAASAESPPSWSATSSAI